MIVVSFGVFVVIVAVFGFVVIVSLFGFSWPKMGGGYWSLVIYEKKSDQKNSVEIGKSLKCKKKKRGWLTR